MATLPKPTTKFAARKTPKAAAKRTAADTPTSTIDDGEDTPQSRTREILANLCNERIREAVMAREASGIEEEWRESQDLYDGFDELNLPTRGMQIPDKNSGPRRKPGGGGQSTILLNITKPKTKVLISRIKEMLVPTNDKPWDMKPTPIPEYDDIEKTPQLAGANIQTGDGTTMPALAAVEILKQKAAEATRGEADWVEDRFVEGRVYGEMRKVIDDAGKVGTGVLKGPFAVSKKTRKWSVDSGNVATLSVQLEANPTSKRVRVQDCYPDPAAGESIHLGEFFNERDFITGRELKKLAMDQSYDREAIANALMEGPMAYAKDRVSGLKDRKKPGDTQRDSSLYTLWYCYGDVPGECLVEMGVEDSKLGNAKHQRNAANDEIGGPLDSQNLATIDNGGPEDVEAEDAFDPSRRGKRKRLSDEQEAALATVPAMVTMLNGRPIKAVLQPLDSGEFPFDFFVIEKVDGQPYGKGVPQQMKAAQLIVKSSVRRMLENGGLSSGQQIAIAKNALTPYDGVYEIAGRKLWQFEASEFLDDVRKAITCFDIPSKQQELMAIINFGLDMADRLTNLPMLMQGDQQAGTAPETLGGLKMFENNAMSPLRDVAKYYDDDLIVPHLTRYHEWFMTHVPDKPKGDTQIDAKGSSALIAREEGRQFLMMLAPVKDDPDYRINPQKYDKELSRANGYDISLIQYTEDEWKQKQADDAKKAPPVSDAVQVAQIRAKVDTDKAGAAHQIAQQNQMSANQREVEDRQLRVQELELKRETLMLELSVKTGASLDDIKARLAIAAMADRRAHEEIALKLSPDNPSHTGI